MDPATSTTDSRTNFCSHRLAHGVDRNGHAGPDVRRDIRRLLGHRIIRFTVWLPLVVQKTNGGAPSRVASARFLKEFLPEPMSIPGRAPLTRVESLCYITAA